MTQDERLIEAYYGQDVDITNPNLVALITEGYKFDTCILNEDFINWRGKVEYHFVEIVYLAKIHNIDVASLSVNTRPNTLADPFWKELLARRPEKSDPNLLAIYIQGIVVHPSYQNQGIASQLLRTMVDYYHPSVILGQTKTPEAVSVRSKVLAEVGYRSFYGFNEVTPGCDYNKEGEGRDFIQAAFASEHFASGQTISARGIYFVDPDVLPSYMPDVMRVTPEIKRAFIPVLESQEAVGHLKSVASVLVSVKESLIDPLSG
ncbi:MAG: hypothetical protein UV73_C0005G0009 [Candidatus Gottesmanbacteria bacterium GW2011_GWA2_43_14]|uniref:N-acetyltransferase domain-containing protein n=1 Tax=Candidatus Gottesmanbacteria bacterium GW2011_GWA2_43_14 TaxID=1618443 RepID=A0A0G1DJI2_9BACT|nr:MAG: hypothetical protein UV73_C0005G0009 [Candidatus Gottesmanbacteria bacterium GW2011_GWA2_43_14]